MTTNRRTPWLLLPFVFIWDLLAWVLRLTGRSVAAIIRFVRMIVGLVISATVIGAVVGVPMLVFGFLLMLRSTF